MFSVFRKVFIASIGRKVVRCKYMMEEISDDDLLPFGGLFGDSHMVRVISQVIADPFEEYRPKDLMELTEISAPSMRKALKKLTRLGFLIEDSQDRQHPVYRVNTASKRYLALTMLAYAVVDDRNGTDCMDGVIAEYYDSDLRSKMEIFSLTEGEKELNTEARLGAEGDQA